MQAALHDDTELLDFNEPERLRPYLDAICALGRDLAAATPNVLRTGALVRALGLAELLEELGPADARVLLFHGAQVLGQADAAGGWLGLHDAPSALLGTGANGPVAVPLDARRWVAWMPEPVLGESLVWADPYRARRCGRAPIDALPLVSVWATGTPLAGKVPARQCIFDADLLQGCAVDAAASLHEAAWRTFIHAQCALLGGLLAGACRRLSREAYRYAQERQSSGKPIAQHQAVALRLADIAMNEQALSLTLQMGVACGAPTITPACISHVAETACSIARDAVQTAAAHGYVEGLPFKRLYEEVHMLCAILKVWSQSMTAFDEQP